MTPEKQIERMKEAGILFPPCKIGDTVYSVGIIDEPLIDAYTVGAIMYDGEKYYVSEDCDCWNEYGSDSALRDASEAIRKFHELREEWEEAKENDKIHDEDI